MSTTLPKFDTARATRCDCSQTCGAAACRPLIAPARYLGWRAALDRLAALLLLAPGLPLMTRYLAEKTALLPLIDLKGACPDLGRSTAGAMRIGAKIGYRGMVREITAYLRKGLHLEKARLLATGGYARWALDGIGLRFKIDPELTLYGIGRIFELNA